MAQSVDEPAPPAPLNRGVNAVVGVILVILLFVALGPLVGAISMLGLLGVFIYSVTIPVAYFAGALPAAITGLAFGLMWIAGVPRKWRYPTTAAFGGVSSVLSTTVVHEFDLGSSMVVGAAGVVAALVASWAAHRAIDAVEASRRADVPSSVGPS